MIRVLAVDPGERVGWATGIIYPETPVLPGPALSVSDLNDEAREIAHPDHRVYETEPASLSVVEHGIAFLKDAALAIHKAVVEEDRIDVVVYETWLLRAAKAKALIGNDMQSSQFIGMVRLACWLNPRVKLVPQGPGAMSSADKSWRAHPSGAAIHERWEALPKAHDDSHDGSALRHLWTYFFDRYA